MKGFVKEMTFKSEVKGEGVKIDGDREDGNCDELNASKMR